jgi:hypothetical protein
MGIFATHLIRSGIIFHSYTGVIPLQAAGITFDF